MSSQLQTIVALCVVAAAAAWLVRRWIRSRNNPGCNDCGACPPSDVKKVAAKAKRG